MHEQRQYLDCWCEETQSNQGLPELAHNWSLRLDRIPEAAITPIEGKCHSSLDQIEVEMHLLRGLAFAYQAKSEDFTVEWLEDKQQVRRVVRRISSTFWFIREIMRYGEDCVVISPASVGDHFKQKLLALCQLYKD